MNDTLLAPNPESALEAAAMDTAAQASAARLAAHIANAAARVAPTWPLDEFIAVNPYWGWLAQPMPAAAARLGVLAGTQLTMPREWFRQQWQQGRLQRQHLEHAIATASDAAQASLPQRTARLHEMLQALDGSAPALQRLPLVADLRDRGTPPRPGSSWTELLTHQISQHCAAFFDQHQAAWAPDRAPGLLGSWMQQVAADRGLPWRPGRALLQARMAAWPSTPQALLAAALDGLAVPEAGREAYCSAALMSVGGWAAWCAYLRWQARLAGRDDDSIEHLLAVRVAWDWLLLADAAPASVPADWAATWAGADAAARALQQAQRTDWLLQAACEAAYQQPLVHALQAGPPAAPAAPAVRPAVQAVFCIDVRSEVFRRALESVSPAVQTRGFAGFFGLPIAYSPLGSALTRPQLPGLLAPAVTVSDQCADTGLGQALATRRRRALQWRQRWAEFRHAPASAFSMVESLGLLSAGKLLVDSAPSSAAPTRWESTGLRRQDSVGLRPCLPAAASDPAAAAAMAKGILGAMGLLAGFAPLVLLAGHGSQTANNPHAAGLDCGACGGQTGEVNARVLAGLLNDTGVRAALRGLGVHVPQGTHFLPGLHNTTTDDVQLFDLDTLPPALQPALAELQAWLAAAGHRARAERAPALGLQARVHDPAALQLALRQRANDWAQVRPEWGLADCAAFIVAPRQRTRHLHLAGRSFLHDYDHRLDPDLAVLTLVMTAPMVVTHWINMQYHASTVDNRRYGSGNKVLHNVVGGNIGVFEGNGGDLRIGLPLQSLHDGQTLRHTPLRLSVFIEAPQAAIDSVMAAHAVVQQLVGNGWLHLFCIDPETGAVTQHRDGAWHAAAVGG
jgi:uncharacterized protein YbcC (UPF0753/DUF2309 family)